MFEMTVLISCSETSESMESNFFQVFSNRNSVSPSLVPADFLNCSNAGVMTLAANFLSMGLFSAARLTGVETRFSTFDRVLTVPLSSTLRGDCFPCVPCVFARTSFDAILGRMVLLLSSVL
jgi:hypothetical protein